MWFWPTNFNAIPNWVEVEFRLSWCNNLLSGTWTPLFFRGLLIYQAKKLETSFSWLLQWTNNNRACLSQGIWMNSQILMVDWTQPPQQELVSNYDHLLLFSSIYQLFILNTLSSNKNSSTVIFLITKGKGKKIRKNNEFFSTLPLVIKNKYLLTVN